MAAKNGHALVNTVNGVTKAMESGEFLISSLREELRIVNWITPL